MKFKYRGWFGRFAKRYCPHSNLYGIFGDQIIHSRGRRLGCYDCNRLLDGPVTLARSRKEHEKEH